MVQLLKEAFGFKTEQRVRLKIETKGADHEDIEHTMPVGSIGIIDHIKVYTGSQGIVFHVWIPVDEAEGRGIVNTFDQLDGPITNYLEVL
ncbi:hypothetical protein [Bradyrhizobium sp. SZCCHNRI2010]|uniref:hypothetical protein n=1 Tax=Bradyrhizobium sp. SZCCHNRI2010 TaxID=3057283 RepID=UPI0028E57911|nr:hypothetical protein [Bradyrhizobium sp. SZCCHNRI2010]